MVREIVASELERIGDERLEMVTVTAVDVDASLETAHVFYSALHAAEEDRLDEVAEALEQQRWKVQQVVNRQVRARRTPQITFRIDTTLDEALRIDEILRDLSTDSADETDSAEDTVSAAETDRVGDAEPGARG